MKILLINPIIREHAPPINFPIGIGIIANIMLQNDFEVTVFDHNALRYDEDTMISELKRIKDVDVVGIGGLITGYGYLKSIVPMVREIFPHSKIVIGGGVTIEPDIVFENIHGVDFCVHGEGEHTFLELCNQFREANSDFESINGISFRKGQEIYRTPERDLERNLDVFPMPAYHLFPTEVYLEHLTFADGHQRQATLITSRGCPNKCTFCWRMTGRGIRFRSVEKILEEVEYLKSNYDIDSMFLLDEAINASEKRLGEVCKGFIDSKVDLPWISHARADRVNPDILNLMKEAGCIWLSVGIESGSKEMLEQMGKNVTPEQNKMAITLIKQAGIKITTSMMLGMPGETQNTVDQSIALLAETKPEAFLFGITTPFPGCDLYYMPEVQNQILERYGSKDKYFQALGDVHRLTINLTSFSDKELIRLRDHASYKTRFKIGPLRRKVQAVVMYSAKYVIPEELYQRLRVVPLVQRVFK
ncbi:MAG: radical SAM protein [Chloroflexota bacterium]|nr:radical SAM protein [Chloroflexota bacterium]